LLFGSKGHWEALIIELGSPNYVKVGAKMMDLEGNVFDMPGYKYLEATKFFLDLKEIFEKTPQGEEEEV
jgi:hypothetical protein